MKHKLLVGACLLTASVFLVMAALSYAGYKSEQTAKVQSEQRSRQSEIQTAVNDQAKKDSVELQGSVKSATLKQCQADLSLYNQLPQSVRTKYPGPSCK